MNVAIAGGHGKIALRLTRLLSERGDTARSLIRNPDHAAEIEAVGGQPVVCDLEHADDAEVARAIAGCNAAVFAAGAGPGSGPERKWTMDHGGAVKLIAACRANGIERYLMVSSRGADPDAPGDDTFAIYLRAKGQADADLRASGLAYTIVRPGGLTDEPATGHVNTSTGDGHISRNDVAAVLASALADSGLAGVTFDLIAGNTPIDEALAALRR